MSMLRHDLSEPIKEGARWRVEEQLYPECRGFRPYYFNSEEEAQTFIDETPEEEPKSD